ncbi:MAG: phosphatidate cytidylyltransferase [Acidobacteriota bacterium]|nr:phosphatidate cytidylyltransferase [Acidobacteriota bacterium]
MRRLLTAAVLIPFILWTVLKAPVWVFIAVVVVVAEICYSEFSGIARAAGFGKLLWIGYLTGLAMLLTPPGHALLVAVLIALLALTISLRSPNLATAFPQAAILILGQLYIFGAWRTAIPLRAMSPYWLVFGLALNWIGDSGAFYVGRKIGRHKLAPRVSPGKSWEGAAASVAVSVIFGVLFLPRVVPGVSIAEAALLAAAVNIAGQLGDLAESALKRGAGVKDSGTLLPGHGGLLDRVDSSIFALPVLYGILRLLRLA